MGREPAAVASAPGRVNLVGEHVDYAEGLVLPMAIDRRTAVAIAPAAGRSRIRSSGFDASWEGRLDTGVASLAADHPASWANYVLGPLDELRLLGLAAGEFDCAIESSVPAGGGVSSSAALEVAVATAVLALAGKTLDGMRLAELCQRAEHRFPKTPCGIMDMAVSANARAGHALLIDCRDLHLTHVPMPSDAELLVVDSGVRHRLSDGGYASRRDAVERAAAALGVRSLRDATIEMVKTLVHDPGVARRARHVVSEISRTRDAAAALVAGDHGRFGELMIASHCSLRDDFEVSVPEVDTIVEAAIGTAGTYGARISGGGFGGCAIALVKRGAAPVVTAAIGAAFRERFGRSPQAFTTTASEGARVELR